MVQLKVHRIVLNKWREKWDHSDKVIYLHETIPNVRDWINNCQFRLKRETTLLLSSYGNVGVHLSRIGSSTCERFDLLDSPAHRIMACHSFADQREGIVRMLGHRPGTTHETISLLGNNINVLGNFIIGERNQSNNVMGIQP